MGYEKHGKIDTCLAEEEAEIAPSLSLLTAAVTVSMPVVGTLLSVCRVNGAAADRIGTADALEVGTGSLSLDVTGAFMIVIVFSGGS